MSFIYIYIFGAPFIFFYLYLLARRFCASLPDERTNDDLRWFRLRRREREREQTPCQKLDTVGLPDRQSVCVSVKLFCDLFSYYPFPPFSPLSIRTTTTTTSLVLSLVIIKHSPIAQRLVVCVSYLLAGSLFRLSLSVWHSGKRKEKKGSSSLVILLLLVIPSSFCLAAEKHKPSRPDSLRGGWRAPTSQQQLSHFPIFFSFLFWEKEFEFWGGLRSTSVLRRGNAIWSFRHLSIEIHALAREWLEDLIIIKGRL